MGDRFYTQQRKGTVRGANRLRRLLRRVEPECRLLVQVETKKIGEMMVYEATNRAPVEYGDLRDSIDYVQTGDKLTVLVGPGAKVAELVRRKTGTYFGGAALSVANMRQANKDLLFQFYKGYWLEFGTKGSPEHNIPPIESQPFMRPAWATVEPTAINGMKQAISKALAKAQGSVGTNE